MTTSAHRHLRSSSGPSSHASRLDTKYSKQLTPTITPSVKKRTMHVYTVHTCLYIDCLSTDLLWPGSQASPVFLFLLLFCFYFVFFSFPFFGLCSVQWAEAEEQLSCYLLNVNQEQERGRPRNEVKSLAAFGGSIAPLVKSNLLHTTLSKPHIVCSPWLVRFLSRVHQTRWMFSGSSPLSSFTL